MSSMAPEPQPAASWTQRQLPPPQLPPTTSTKAIVAAVVLLASMAGLQLSDSAQLWVQTVVVVAQLLVGTFLVWRAPNRRKLPRPGRRARR